MKFILEPDASGEPIIWALEGGDTDNYQYTGILSRVDLHPDARRFWDDVVARMTGTTITRDDATVDVIARAMYEFKFASARVPDPLPWDHPRMNWYVGDWVREQFRPQARAVLAALTGVPHD